VIQYALQFAQPDTEFILIHIVESASAKLIGEESEDYETRKDKEMLKDYVSFLESKSHKATAMLGYRNRNKEIARIVKESGADLLILGSHGHKGLKDLVLGETINEVRHLIKIPVFIAK
jgi:manganese transport protein